jgi:hypothetical protein
VWEVGAMLKNFFELPGTPSDIDQNGFFDLTKSPSEIRSKIYRPDSLKSLNKLRQWEVKNCQFVEVSFSKTLIEEIEFIKCKFTDCLFIRSIFKDCRFTDCEFVDSNTHRIKFVDVYLNPRSFEKCLNKNQHQNIGVHLYQELLNNSRRQSQPDFAHEALFEFRRWLRFEYIYRLRQGKISWGQAKLALLIAQNWGAQKFLGFGVRLRNYFLTAVGVALVFATINYCAASQLGLKISADPPQPFSFFDALYFTIITLTTIGYGDITPTTECGRVFIAIEGVFGFILFAILASMIYRKILP